MSCIITYKGNKYTENDFKKYITNNKEEFSRQILNSPETIKEFKEFVGENNLTPTILLPIGTSGSGKSTFIKTLSKDKYITISPDEIRVEFTGDMNDKSKDKEIYEAVKERAIQAVKSGKSVIIDTTNLQKDRRRDFINAINFVLPNTKIEYKLLELNPELAKQRIKAQIQRGENRANVPDSTIDRHALLYKEMLEDIKSENIFKFKDFTNNQNIQFENITEQQNKSIDDLKEESSETFEENKMNGPKELIRPKSISLADWDSMSIKEQVEAIDQDKNC